MMNQETAMKKRKEGKANAANGRSLRLTLLSDMRLRCPLSGVERVQRATALIAYEFIMKLISDYCFCPGFGLYTKFYALPLDSIEHFLDALVDYLDYYNNCRIKVKLKGLPPAIHRRHALAAA